MALLKSRDVSVDPNNPWDGDPFERKVHGDRLLALVRSLQDLPYVIAINGDWGTGKSTFLKRLEYHFERAAPKVPFIRIDAWATDDAEDPLVPFVASIQMRIRETQTLAQKSREALVEAAVKLAVPVTSLAANLIAPGSGSAIDAATKFGQTLIDWELARSDSTKAFRKALEGARDALTGHENGDRIQRPIVIALDELDRCRPDFSIRALERIKHFFNVPGVIFLIATDQGNLPAAVRCVYGESVDGELYLRKFFDYEYRLPRPTAYANIHALWSEFGMSSVLPETLEEPLVQNAFYRADKYYEFVTKFRSSLDAFEYKQHFAHICEVFQLSLRDQSQAFTMLSAHVRTTPESFVRIPLIDCFSVCLRFFHPPSFDLLRAGAFSFSSIPGDYPHRIRSALNTFANSSDGQALARYFGHATDDSVVEALQHDIKRLSSQNQTVVVPAFERLYYRIRLNRKAPPEYVSTLLGLLYSFTPQEDQ